MAKTALMVVDSDPTVHRLKKVLFRLVKAIVDDEDYSIETIVEAEETLRALKELQLSTCSFSFKLQDILLSCPEEFRCPLSKELMTDPVILYSGQTYDNPYIQKWLKAGNRSCPLTQKVLAVNTTLIPNYLIREIIAEWCKNKGIELSAIVNKEGITKSDRDNFHFLLEKISSSFVEQQEAAKELQLLTKMPSFHALFGESVDAIPQLLNPLSGHDSLQKGIMTTLLNLSNHDDNKKLLAENRVVMALLMKDLGSGTTETRSIAAATLFNLSILDSNKEIIGKSGALKLLIDLLEEGLSLVVKDVASAIFTLCAMDDNKKRAVTEGAVGVILKKIMSNSNIDEILPILGILSENAYGLRDMRKLKAVPALLGIIRVTSCERNKEICIVILHNICLYDRTKLQEIREEENNHGTISAIAQNGTPRAKREATWILGRLRSVSAMLDDWLFKITKSD
ncbi:RING-type E3 ubiquitin transferase [Quillaja saponaria]|uniref:RING-type E3 ubiquitin transferase n=1 Tax=Quillaja saponaria TaxID=32244 RepID=A0AAD7LP60_QUISA|nr:RING-type E3 ubiquitin transferase [Quillaja saponaria]